MVSTYEGGIHVSVESVFPNKRRGSKNDWEPAIVNFLQECYSLSSDDEANDNELAETINVHVYKTVGMVDSQRKGMLPRGEFSFSACGHF